MGRRDMDERRRPCGERIDHEAVASTSTLSTCPPVASNAQRAPWYPGFSTMLAAPAEKQPRRDVDAFLNAADDNDSIASATMPRVIAR